MPAPTIVIATILAFALGGCQTVPPVGGWYRAPVLINGFDPTLSSHREALGLPR